MKTILSLIAVFLFIVTSYSQSQKIDKGDYDGAFMFAVSETNKDYPLIFKVTTKVFEKAKLVLTTTEVNENESQGYYRKKRTVLKDGGKMTSSYQITAGFGNVFCSNDGVAWTGPTQYECPRDITLYGPAVPESVEYSITKTVLEGKKVMVYRKYSLFAPSKGGKIKEFREKVATIDSRGFFVTVVDTEGTVGPKTVTLIREQSWITQAKIAPVVAPK